MHHSDDKFYGTTILAVKTKKSITIAGDGQVTLGNVIMKGNAIKVRSLFEEKVIAGFAGATADAFTLFEKFESYLHKFSGQLTRSAVELAKEWRTDRYLRRLEAMMLVADKDSILLISGNGDVIEPQEDYIAIGSGGNYAYAAAAALVKNNKELSSKDIAEKALNIAADLCIYTNHNLRVKTLMS